MKQLLGHSKLSTTQKYRHELEGQQREARGKIENLIWFPKKQTDQEENRNSNLGCGPMGRRCNCCK